MPVVDPFVPLREWRSSLYRGNKVVIDQFLDKIDPTQPSGWVRDLAYEQTRPQSDRIRCYLFDQPGQVALRVWLQRVTATRVRGGPVQLLRHPPAGGTEQIGQLVAYFTDSCVVAAAKAVGADYTQPAFGTRSAITSDVEMLFTRLADTADGEWPLTGQAQTLWDELISTCLAELIAIDRHELEKWLADNGWEKPTVTSIAERFFADSEWLAKRLAVSAL
jgi:hypothetical protein